MKLKLDRTYETSDGRKYYIQRSAMTECKLAIILFLGVPVLEENGKIIPQWFTEEGMWFVNGMTSELDLIKESDVYLAKS